MSDGAFVLYATDALHGNSIHVAEETNKQAGVAPPNSAVMKPELRPDWAEAKLPLGKHGPLFDVPAATQ